ncbi:hypothetical protein B0J17DRAFT_314468 [Rhizoctonia solani]|nr:hypothetical protein B0J17DRAFT_314468 [Rhizoctonia solani]
MLGRWATRCTFLELTCGTWVLMDYAISQTLMLDLGPPNAWPYFAVPALTLVPSKGPLPDSEALKQTYDLACASNSFAQRSSIGSLLAGPGSESDEFADVGFWCGEIDENEKEVSILQSLSLDPWIQKGTITRLDDAPLRTLRKSEMWELCEALANLTEFRVERPDAGGRVMYVMAGKGSKGWCGLIGRHRAHCTHTSCWEQGEAAKFRLNQVHMAYVLYCSILCWNVYFETLCSCVPALNFSGGAIALFSLPGGFRVTPLSFFSIRILSVRASHGFCGICVA